MSKTEDQQHFTVVQMVADWHELIVAQKSSAHSLGIDYHANNATSRYTTAS